MDRASCAYGAQEGLNPVSKQIIGIPVFYKLLTDFNL